VPAREGACVADRRAREATRGDDGTRAASVVVAIMGTTRVPVGDQREGSARVFGVRKAWVQRRRGRARDVRDNSARLKIHVHSAICLVTPIDVLRVLHRCFILFMSHERRIAKTNIREPKPRSPKRNRKNFIRSGTT
jgi:hypothetical protein